VPAVRDYKYVKAKDEISATALPQKEAKERDVDPVGVVGSGRVGL
jgi:hypothetical protein